MRTTERMMSMSCAMTCCAPGRCTLTATSSPVTRRARCTCASDALPSGLGSIASNICPRRWPYSSSRHRSTTSYGTGSTSERRRRSSSQNRCGKISERLARICPILTNIGPSSSSRRRRRTGVRLSHTRYFLIRRTICPMRSRRPAGVSWYSSSGAIASGSSGTISTARGFLRAPETAASTSSTTAASSPKGS